MEEVNYDSIIQLNRLENKTEEILIKLQNHWNRMDAISREIGILSRYEENQISQFFYTGTAWMSLESNQRA